MIKYEYNITTHPEEEFNKLVYFCSEQGECELNQLQPNQLNILKKILNENGSQGWELIQLNFGKGGVVAFWKKVI